MDIQKEINELKEMFSLLVQELEKRKKEPKEFELFIKTEGVSDHLVIGFNANCHFYILGRITHEGKCYFMTHEKHHYHWEIWKKQGFKVAEQEPVEWQGLFWWLGEENGLTVSKITRNNYDYIYNFREKANYTNIYADGDFLQKDSNFRINLF